MFAWQFKHGSVVVSRLQPACPGKDIAEVKSLQKSFLTHHYDVHNPSKQPATVKKKCIQYWECILKTGDIRNMLGEGPRTYLVARSKSGHIEGYLSFLTVDEAPNARISHIAVRKSSRNRGIGRALMQGFRQY